MNTLKKLGSTLLYLFLLIKVADGMDYLPAKIYCSIHQALVRGERAEALRLLQSLTSESLDVWRQKNVYLRWNGVAVGSLTGTQIANDLKQADRLELPPLHLAAFLGYDDVVQKLCDLMGEDSDPNSHSTDKRYLNFFDHNHDSPLHLASGAGHVDVVEVLLNRKADINSASFKSGATALHMSVMGGHPDVTQLLLNAGADVNRANSKTGMTPLAEAIQIFNVPLVRMLLDSGRVDVNAELKHGSDKPSGHEDGWILSRLTQEGSTYMELTILGCVFSSIGGLANKALTRERSDRAKDLFEAVLSQPTLDLERKVLRGGQERPLISVLKERLLRYSALRGFAGLLDERQKKGTVRGATPTLPPSGGKESSGLFGEDRKARKRSLISNLMAQVREEDERDNSTGGKSAPSASSPVIPSVCTIDLSSLQGGYGQRTDSSSIIGSAIQGMVENGTKTLVFYPRKEFSLGESVVDCKDNSVLNALESSIRKFSQQLQCVEVVDVKNLNVAINRTQEFIQAVSLLENLKTFRFDAINIFSMGNMPLLPSDGGFGKLEQLEMSGFVPSFSYSNFRKALYRAIYDYNYFPCLQTVKLSREGNVEIIDLSEFREFMIAEQRRESGASELIQAFIG